MKLKQTFRWLLYGVLGFFIFLMFQIVWRYVGLDTDVGFLRIKQQYLTNQFWLVNFYIHSFTAILCLFAGFTQFSSTLRNSNLKLHRIFGRVYVYVVCLLAAPSGLVLGVYANGHLPSKVGFSLLAILWFWFTLKAVQLAKQRRLAQHQAFIIRSYALALSAITLRVWKFVLANTLEPDPLDLYQIVTWLGFVPNLLVAEWIVYRIKPKSDAFVK